MENIKKYFSNVDKKFEKLNKRISVLQDLILHMKTEFELLTRSKIEKECFSEMAITTDDNIKHFLDERPSNCQLLDECTIFMEKGVLKILRVFVEKGAKSAIEKINLYKQFTKTNPKIKKCPNKICLTNAIEVFKKLEQLIGSSKETSTKLTKDLFSINRELSLIEGNEEECNLLSPLANEIRLKILKILSKGGRYYTQLEREIGLKGGHFHFHLDKLIEARYVIQEEEKGPYLITTNGLKALKFLYELKQEMILV